MSQLIVSVLFVFFVTLSVIFLVWGDRFLYRQFVRRYPKLSASIVGRIYRTIIALMPLLFVGALVGRRLIGSHHPLMFALTLTVALWYLPKLPLIVGMLTLALFRRYRRRRRQQLLPVSAKRRRLMESIATLSLAYPYWIAATGAVRTTYRFQVHREQIAFPALPPEFSPLRIVHISDFHTGSFPDPIPFFRSVFEAVQYLQPDIVAITGDWVNFDPAELQPILPLLQNLNPPIGTFGCLGNHDHYMSNAKHRRLQELIRQAGVRLLVNQSVVFERKNAVLAIVGTDNTGTGQHFGDIVQAMRSVPAGAFTILLAHTPSYWDKEIRGKQPVHLMLAGHTHGGQLTLPLGVVTLNPAYLVFRYVQGLYVHSSDQKLYVNAGLGTTLFPLRTGVAPEITLLELVNSPTAEG